MNRDEFMELVYETFADEPDNVLANGIIEAADAYVEYEKAQLSREDTTSDTISRQAALDIFDDYNISVENGELEAYRRDRKRLCELPTVQPEERTEKRTESHACDSISRHDAIDALASQMPKPYTPDGSHPADEGIFQVQEVYADCIETLELLPPVQPEQCEYYALCRHGRDENKLRSALGCCDYCTEDSDGYVKPIEKNSHAFIRFGMDGWELDLRAKGWHGSAKIMYCPMCGRRLERG